MTTATLQFDHPTLFRDGRFSRDDVAGPDAQRAHQPAPASRPGAAAAAPPREHATAAPALHAAAPSNASAPRGSLSLDEVLSAAWDGLTAHHSVTCPVCSGQMAPRYGSGAKPVGGRCTRCGSTLG